MQCRGVDFNDPEFGFKEEEKDHIKVAYHSLSFESHTDAS